MAITVQQAWAAVTDVKKDISDISTAAQLRGACYVNELFYNTGFDIDPEQSLKNQLYTVLPQVTTYALPSDFRTINCTNAGLYQINDTTQTAEELALTGFGSQLNGYYLNGNNLVITPNPQTSSQFTLRYVPELTDLASLSDTFNLYITTQTRHLEFVKAALLQWYELFDQNLIGESIAGQRFDNIMQMFAENISKAPLVRPIDDISYAY